MSADATTDTAAAGSVISLPKGGGAVGGIGEKFATDLFTGTGNVSVPIPVPAGRHGMEPTLALGYSTGTGNGPFGLGWQLGLPGVTRRTSRGVPRYVDAAEPGAEAADVFVLSGVEDLVPVAGAYPGRVRYRPRTEGLFARIEHVRDASGDYWEVRAKDGTRTRYGTPRPAGAPAGWRDPAVVSDPAEAGRVFGWRITEARDPSGNTVRYDYLRDAGADAGHRWDQPLLATISYADYGDPADPSFLVTVSFSYEPRPDPFSDYRAGFEVRTSLRCRTIRISTHATDGVDRVAREYRLTYRQAGFNGASLLARVDTVGIDEAATGLDGQPATEQLPPLTLEYSDLDVAGRRFTAVTGMALPPEPLTDPAVALVDLHGVGLPDLVQFGVEPRFWRNAGGGRFEAPRTLAEAPSFALGQPGVRLLDADGDGRPDLVVTPAATAGAPGRAAGYFPMTFPAGWSRRSFQPYRQLPSVHLGDPGVKLVDLDGDGLTDVLSSGARLQAWFNDPDPRLAWRRTVPGNGSSPDVDLADPRVRLADMTGDGLADIVVLRNGNVSYWPNLGHGRWGEKVTMRRAPRLPDGYDPRRLLLGDVDGDGVADLVYVDAGRVLLWGNQHGNAWTEAPEVVTGTPGTTSADAVQFADLTGSGTGGLLYQRAPDGTGRPALWFLDLTGGAKPYLLTAADNHLGAVTRVRYRPSTQDYLRDRAAGRGWRTTLPFPVHVVAATEVLDAFSGGRLTTEYRYHHGYWDGVEREFRGFAMVEQLDTEAFSPPPGSGDNPPEHYSPPTLAKNWFHPGPVAAAETGDWTELDLRHEYWRGDAPMLTRPAEVAALLAGLSRADRRAALRALRGRALRTELYGLDGSDRAGRPYTVTETLTGVRAEAASAVAGVRTRVFFPFELARRSTQWERGAEPMTKFSFSDGYDAFGYPTRQVAVAVPRGRDPRVAADGTVAPYLATAAVTEYARRDDDAHYLVDRVARTGGYEVVNDGRLAAADLRDAALAVLAGRIPSGGVSLRLIEHSRTYYDGEAFTGLPLGVLGEHGLPVRAESLAFTDAFLDGLFDPNDPRAVTPRPGYLTPGAPLAWPAEYPPEFRDSVPTLAGYRHYTDADVPGSPGGFYTVTTRTRYDVQTPGRVPRGLALAQRDPMGAESSVSYDAHDLLPVRAADPAGLATAAAYDYRVLQPRELTDVNGNPSSVTFSPAGHVTAQFVRGKDGTADREVASTRVTYDLLAVDERGEPASVHTMRRVHHDTETDVPAAQRDEVIVSVTFADGFGRTLQIRSQAEDTLYGDPTFGGGVLPADQSAPPGDATGRTRAPALPDNVTVSGWQVYDNKGRVVRRYEPFFSSGYAYAQPGEDQLGQPTVIFYDPRGHAVRTVHADGSEQRVVLGVPVDVADPDVYTPTPWETFTYDANDNAGRTHAKTAGGYATHWNTPGSVEADALGRTVATVTRNSTDAKAPGAVLVTRSSYDIQGNLVSVTDALGREAFRYTYDLARRRWRVDGIDSGRRDVVLDAIGEVIESRDAKGALALGAFDALRRPVRMWARNEAAGPVTLRRRVDYGDGGSADQPPAQRDAARAANLLGRASRLYDEAGLVTVDAVDAKGNLLQTTRRVIADAPLLATYVAGAKAGWNVPLFVVDWQPAAGQTQEARDAQLLESAAYTSATGYDALNRPTNHILPKDVEGRRRVIQAQYNRAGGLDAVSLDGTVHVRRISYNARGQRALLVRGNGTMTRYAYDPRTFRLARVRSEQYTSTDEVTYHPKGAALQDYAYDYDLVGNVLAVHDRTPGSGLPGTPDALDRQFGYDPIYRLLSATGRESAPLPAGDPWLDTPRGVDPTRTQQYQERYTYDAVGTLVQLVHSAAVGFTREFVPGPDTNRLRRMTTGKILYDYSYDASGNLRTETATRHYGWNHADRLASFATQTPGAEPSVHAHYLYDATGARVKKLVRKQGGAVEVTHYIGGLFEHRRWATPSAGANNQVHILDDRHRVALVRVGPAHPDDRGPGVAFHLGDHLGSSTAVVDGSGALTNREEYTPYGETSFGSYTRKRYRFTGRERDEESSLGYHRARYYAPWLGRWQSVDPAAGPDAVNAYDYCFGNPIAFSDANGADPARDVARRWDADRNGKLDADEVVAGYDSTPGTATIDFLMMPGNTRFTRGGEMARQVILTGHFAALAEQEARFEASNARQLRMWSDGSVSTSAERKNYLFLRDFYGGADVRNGLLFGALYYAATGDQDGARMVNGLFGGLGGVASGVNAARAAAAAVNSAPRPAGVSSAPPAPAAPATPARPPARLPQVVIRYNATMARSPSDAQFLRFNLQWAQSAQGFLTRGARTPGDAALRAAARDHMDQTGFNRAGTNAMHALDSVANPYLRPGGPAGTTYYFGNSSVNQSFGSQLSNEMRRLGIQPGDNFTVQFVGFPDLSAVPPTAPPSSPPNLRGAR